MKIKKFEWHDTASLWHLQPTDFFPMTLLVGPSGAGKTKILRSIIGLQDIIDGESINGVKWNVEIELRKNEIYHWYGEFELVDTLIEIEDEKYKPQLINEKLYLNKKLLIERQKNEIKFMGNKTPKLASYQSVLYHFREEEKIQQIYNEFQKINLNDQTTSIELPRRFPYFNKSKVDEKYESLDDIKNSQEKLLTKLYLVYKKCPEMFDSIIELFCSIFPNTEDVKFEPLTASDIPDVLKEYPFIQLKEKDVDNWIDQGDISSGMFSTLMHICEIMLSADGSVILIDEFENSLGVNCINDIMTEILSTNRDLQFIITSHHPYIINEIDYKKWKIVTRIGGDVIVKNASDFNIGKSKHEAFLQLINLPVFTDGIG